MKGKTIVLADSSYTIRRIVELSFSEIEDVEIVSFENGLELKNKLLDIKPRVMIVDVKLPGVSGYEICQFINQNEELKKTRIFLMKGSFEPINQEWIKNLKFEEIITKPFDSNLLVAAVMKILDENEKAKSLSDFPGGMPPSMPEDFASIDTGTVVEEELNFSDIRDEILTSGHAPKKPVVDEDEIQPSEEITQAQATKDDSLAPESEEAIGNPFESEPSITPGSIQVEKPASEPIQPVPPKVDLGLAPQKNEPEVAPGEEPQFAGAANEETSETSEEISLEGQHGETAEESQFPGDLLDQPHMSIDLPAAPEPPVGNGVAGLEAARAEEGSGVPRAFPGDGKKMSDARKERSGDSFFPLEGSIKRPVSADETGEVTRPMKKTSLLTDSSQVDKKELENRLNEQLTLSIREVLWEIIPRLAEKIIREEIEKIKSEVARTEQ